MHASTTDAPRSAAVIAVGSELLGVDRLDTNSLRIAALLEEFGIELRLKLVVPDVTEDLVRALESAARGADLILMTGGLGPTLDDLTREAVAQWSGRDIALDVDVLAWIEEMYSRRGRRMPAPNRRQAEVISGAEVLRNELGTAPGLLLETDDVTVILLPGVPLEVDGLLETAVRPWLEQNARLETRSSTLEMKAACVPESRVEELLGPVYDRWGAEAVAVLARPGEVTVRLRLRDPEELARGEAVLSEVLGDILFSRCLGGSAPSLEETVLNGLGAVGQTLAVAESCTGGGLGARLTDVAGSSRSFLGGVISYSNELKESLLGVDPEVLAEVGAVSAEVAAQMACGARERCGSDWALAITGIAGPGGGSAEKPVGTVWFGLARPDESGGVGLARSERGLFPGDRLRVRQQATQYALDMLRRALSGLQPLRWEEILDDTRTPAVPK